MQKNNMQKYTFYIPNAKEIMDKVVKKVKSKLDNLKNTAKKPKHIFIAEKEKKRICLINKEVKIELTNILKQFPSIDKLEDVQKELFLNEIDLKTIKQNLSHVAKTKFLLNDLKNKYLKKINSNPKSAPKFRSEFLGRTFSVIKKLDPSLNYIRISAKTLRKAPEFKNYPTAVLVGLPNCGKSTFLNKITGSKVEIKDYPFTTQRLQVGLFEEKYQKYQLIDSPGLLVRDPSKMNIIEKQTIIAIKKLAKAIIYLIALNEDAEKQKKLIKKMQSMENKNYIIIYTKKDLMLPEEIDEFISHFTNLEPKASFILNLNRLSTEEINKLKQEISKLLS